MLKLEEPGEYKDIAKKDLRKLDKIRKFKGVTYLWSIIATILIVSLGIVVFVFTQFGLVSHNITYVMVWWSIPIFFLSGALGSNKPYIAVFYAIVFRAVVLVLLIVLTVYGVLLIIYYIIYVVSRRTGPRLPGMISSILILTFEAVVWFVAIACYWIMTQFIKEYSKLSSEQNIGFLKKGKIGIKCFLRNEVTRFWNLERDDLRVYQVISVIHFIYLLFLLVTTIIALIHSLFGEPIDTIIPLIWIFLIPIIWLGQFFLETMQRDENRTGLQIVMSLVYLGSLALHFFFVLFYLIYLLVVCGNIVCISPVKIVSITTFIITIISMIQALVDIVLWGYTLWKIISFKRWRGKIRTDLESKQFLSTESKIGETKEYVNFKNFMYQIKGKVIGGPVNLVGSSHNHKFQ